MKVFCIGFNKSGTTSLHLTFIRLGHASIHGDIRSENIDEERFSPMPSPDTVRTRIAEVSRKGEWMGGDLGSLEEIYDCYSDGENHNFERLHTQYPDAFFILNTRRLDQWVNSRIKHVKRASENVYHVNHHLKCPFANGDASAELVRRDDEVCSDYMDPCPFDLSDGAIKRWVLNRNAYHRRVLEYFGDNKRFMVISIGVDSVVEKLRLLPGCSSVSATEIRANKARRDFGLGIVATRRRLQRIGVDRRDFECSLASENLTRLRC